MNLSFAGRRRGTAGPVVRLITLFIILLAVSAGVMVAQDDNGDVPPATQTAQTSLGLVEGERISLANNYDGPTELPRTYSQDDMSVLVGNVQRPNGLVYYDDYLYTACNGDWTLYKINATSGATETYIFGVRDAHTLVADPVNGGVDLYIPDFATNTVKYVPAARNAPSDLVTSTTPGVAGPWGMTRLSDDFFLLSSLLGNSLSTVSRNGQTTILRDGFRSPAGVAFDGQRVYVANLGSSRRSLEYFDLSFTEATRSFESTEPQPLVRGLQNVSNLVLADDGFLYFTYSLGTRGVVGRINPLECLDGGCGSEDIELVLFSELQAPLAGLAISPDMRVFVHTIYRPEIYWIDVYNPPAAETPDE